MKKLKSNKGFTLIEMLACVVTLVLIILICTTGMNMAMKSYRESLFESNSQMLESTLNTAIADVLRYADDVDTSGTLPVFKNEGSGVERGRIAVSDEGYFMLITKMDADDIIIEEFHLLNKKAYAEDLYIVGFELNYDAEDDKNIFTGKYTILSNLLAGASRTVEFSYRSIADR